MCQKLWKFISLLLFLENNSFFFITRGRLVRFFYCSEININEINNELCFRKEDILKCVYRVAENVTSSKTLLI